MKKKGFTLVELLGVIVILAVIALIAVPTILGVIDKAKRSSLQDSGYGLVEADNLYYAQYQNSKTVRFDIEDNKITTEEENKLNYKGNIKNGTVLINKKGQVTVCINDGKHAAYKNYQDTKVIVVDSKTCTVPENKYVVYLDDEATITEMTNQELTDAVTNLIEQVNILKQENAQLKQQVNNESDSTQVSTLQLRHDNDITSIWNKVGTEDLSSISDGSISQILIDNNKLVSDLNDLIVSQGTTINNLQAMVNAKADSTIVNTLSSQINNINTSLNNKVDSGHTHDDRYYTESEIDTKLNSKANSSDLESLKTTISSNTTNINTINSNISSLTNAVNKINNSFWTSTVVDGWSTVTENGYSFTTIYTGMIQFFPNNRCDIRLSVGVRTNASDDSNYGFSKFLNMDSVKSQFSLTNLSFDPPQAFVTIESANSSQNYPAVSNEFSTIMMTSDGRLTRRYWDGSSIQYGNIFLKDYEGMVWGTRFIIDIKGAICS